MDPDCQKLMNILTEKIRIHPRNISGIEELSCNSVIVRARVGTELPRWH